MEVLKDVTTSRAEVKQPILKYETSKAKEITIHWSGGTSSDLSYTAELAKFNEIRVSWTDEAESGNLMILYYREDGKAAKKSIFPANSIFQVDIEYD